MNEDKKILIKAELDRRRLIATGSKFLPYINRDGSKSWQTTCNELLSSEDTNEIWAILANGVGKSAYLAYLILTVLYGSHSVCKVWNGEAIHMHVITEDSGIQKATIQQEMAQQTDFKITGYSSKNTPENIHIQRHSGRIVEMVNLDNNHRLTFGTAQEGATGTVGLAPHIIASDEPIAEELYQEIVARNRRPKAKFLMLATPLSNKHAWVIHRANDIKEKKLDIPGVYVLQARSIDNPYFPAEKLDYWKQNFGGESNAYRVRALGELIVTEGLVVPGVIDNIVPNDYIPSEFAEQERFGMQPYKTYVSMDLGLYDATIMGFFNLYPNGEIVMQDEVVLHGKTLPEWCDELIKKMHELNYPLASQGAGKLVYFDERTQTGVCKPTRMVVDGQYSKRRNHTTGLTILHEFGLRKIFPTPSAGGSKMEKIPLLCALVKSGELKFKERCIETISMLTKHTYTEGKNGKITIDSPYDHATDVLKYLLEILPPTKAIQNFEHKQKLKDTFTNNQLPRYNQFKKGTL